MSGLMSANSLQRTPISPASFFCRGRSVLFPDADAPFVFMTTGRSCRGNSSYGSAAAAFFSSGFDEAADGLAAVGIAREVERERRDRVAIAPDPAVARDQRGGDARQSAARGGSRRILAAACAGLPGGDGGALDIDDVDRWRAASRRAME